MVFNMVLILFNDGMIMESWWDNTRILMDIPSGKLTWLLKMAIESDDLPIENGDFGDWS